MENKKLEKVLQIIRENMVANAPGTQGGFGSKSDASGPTAGYDGPIKKKDMQRVGVVVERTG
jgi:hypothetical protein